MGKKGGFPGGGIPGGMGNIMKQAQRMQRQMEEKQKEMETKECLELHLQRKLSTLMISKP